MTEKSLSLVSANTAGQPLEFANILMQSDIPDIIVLQEAYRRKRQSIAEFFPDHQFFYGTDDANHDKNNALVFTNVIGLRRSVFETERAIVTADVTSYRTIAVQVTMRAEPSKALAVVNVHTTKALAFYSGLHSFLFQSPSKFQRHVNERIAIENWTGALPKGTAIVLAGDFNAPTKTAGARLRGMTNSHLAVSTDSLLTFPESWPLVGIDHVFGNDQITFTSSETLRNRSSDHRYRRVKFRI